MNDLLKHSFNCLFLFFCLLLENSSVEAQVSPPLAFGPVPTKDQLAWQQMEFYAFVHLSVNTYTDMAWGKGDEDPQLFDPAQLDCREWARIAKDAGMKGIIITAKHHSGFCLWPSKYTSYSVKNAPWKNGKGDVVREMADACKEYGLKFGVYLSPWDRNHPDYGKPEYITYFRNQLTELLTNYGEVFEVWFDGANGGTGYYGGANENRKIDRTTYYDWPNTYKLVRELQPNIVIWNDGGDRADLRWVGTEAGYVGEKNWSLLNATGDVTEEMLRHGLENGNAWVPGEVNTSIRPEWFYHQKEDAKVKTVPQLMDIYYNSVGRNGTLLLNFPIMPNGLIHEKDKKAMEGFTKARKEAFANDLTRNAKVEATQVRGNSPQYAADKVIDRNKSTYWTTNDEIKNASLTIRFQQPATFNRLLLQEYIVLGQRVKSFTVEAMVDGNWKQLASETTIGYKRILKLPTVKATSIRVTITDAKSCPLISTIEVYNAPQLLTAPVITREQSGRIHITPADTESELYYTLTGKRPDITSVRYKQPITTDDGKVKINAIAYNPVTGKKSPVAEQRFDISRKNWKILSEHNADAYRIIDGDENTPWHPDESLKLPVALVLDLGKEENLTGFRYLPDQFWWANGIVSQYQLYLSMDNNDWRLVSEGEFANIKNNPVWQVIQFSPQKARYIKFRAMKNTQADNSVGYGEVDVITAQ